MQVDSQSHVLDEEAKRDMDGEIRSLIELPWQHVSREGIEDMVLHLPKGGEARLHLKKQEHDMLSSKLSVGPFEWVTSEFRTDFCSPSQIYVKNDKGNKVRHP